ncbi:MAG: rRNA adenine N-6-methyltransferase family protein [Erythrobacter sp.]|jgi:hypothetical protein|nr:rRNA adenine N-6-methyltransferase family protein [Erythrobacter sp.]
MNEARTFLEPLAGLLLDEISKVRNRPFVPHSLTKLRNLKMCRDLAGGSTAVEIGTYKGVTTKRLSRIFDQVVSVEIDARLYNLATERLKGRSNVRLVHGEGERVLVEISKEVDKAVLFLDGHFSGGDTGLGDEPEPVLTELDAIAPNLENFVAIVIDDFRLFGVDAGWPKKSEVMAKLEAVLPSTWRIMVLNDQFIAIRA